MREPLPCIVEGCSKIRIARGFCTLHYQRWRRHSDPLAGKTGHGVPTRWIMSHVGHTETACLYWPFYCNPFGYPGAVMTADGPKMANEVMCKLKNGEKPSPHHQVAHSCGNGKRGCINPMHLRWDTRAGNEADKILHGTSNRGKRNGQAKLTEKDIKTIRSMEGRFIQKEIAEVFGISRGAVSSILLKKIWAWLD